MASTHNLGGNYWGYLINPDKSAAPLLKQLCLGLAEIVGYLEPTSPCDQMLTPARMAAFYRAVGGNYDSLFLSNSHSGISFMYKTLGCFHSLQPTSNPMETPSIPALTADGFTEWQRIQILLSPGEHVPFLQKAVSLWDVRRPDGLFFPKHIPREAFPEKPDDEMDRWHRNVTGRLNQESEIRRIQNSPYPSPYNDRSDGYFTPAGRLPVPQGRRSSRPSKNGSHDQELAHRRSSVPDLPSPMAENGHGNESHGRPVDAARRTSRSQSAHRPSNSSAHHRSSAASSQQRPPSSAHRPSSASLNYRGSSAVPDANGAHLLRHPPQRPRSHTLHPRSPSTIDETSGSDASSEDSITGRRKGKNGKGDRRRDSLFPPESPHHKRRHSHDATYLSNGNPPLPPRPSGYLPSVKQGNSAHNSPVRTSFQHPTASLSARPTGLGLNSVHFNPHIFDASREEVANSAPELVLANPYNANSRPSASQTRYLDHPPPNSYQLTDGSSGSGSGNSNERDARIHGAPLRVLTESGVGGRRYPNPQPRSAVERRSTTATPV